jgi:opacity protein-like surface antigen
MKRILLLLLVFISQMSCLKAFDIQGRVAYFLPQDSRMRDIYGKNGFAEYEIEASTPLSSIYACSPCNWDAFANLSFYQQRGHSSCLNDRTRVQNWALNFGVKRYFENCWCFRPYLGVGAGAVHARFNDHSDFVSRHTNRWGITILAKSGIRYDITCNLFLDLFADYSYSWFNVPSRVSCVSVRNVNTGGLKLGCGLGYQF